MAIRLNDNIETKAPKLLDSRQSLNGRVPYTSVQEATSNVQKIFRSRGLTAYILSQEGELQPYWYRDGVEDEDLVRIRLSDLSNTGDTAGDVFVTFEDLYQGNVFLSGGFEHLQNYDYFVWADKYIINNVMFQTYISKTVTLQPSDPNFDRIDVIVVDDTETISVVTGTPSANPEKPSLNQENQLEVTFILVKANSASPDDIVNKLIYDENLQQPNEADTTGAGNVDLESLENPYTGTKSLKYEDDSASVKFKLQEVFHKDEFDFLILHIWNTTVDSRFIISANDTLVTTSVSNSVLIEPGKYGYNSATSIWHKLVIPLEDFNLSTIPYEGFTIAKSQGGISFVDKISMQSNGGVYVEGLYTGGLNINIKNKVIDVDIVNNIKSKVFLGSLSHRPYGMTIDKDDNLYFSQFQHTLITKIAPSGEVTNFGPVSGVVESMTSDEDGNIYGTNTHATGGSIFKITSSGNILTILDLGVHGGDSARHVMIDSNGKLKITCRNSSNILEADLDGNNVSVFATVGDWGSQVVEDSQGNFWLPSSNDDKTYKIGPNGAVITDFNTPGKPDHIAIDSQDNVYVTCFDSNTVFKIDSLDNLSVFEDGVVDPLAVTVDKNDFLYLSSFSENKVYIFSPEGDKRVFGNTGSNPYKIELDSRGNIYSLDRSAYQITKIYNMNHMVVDSYNKIQTGTVEELWEEVLKLESSVLNWGVEEW